MLPTHVVGVGAEQQQQQQEATNSSMGTYPPTMTSVLSTRANGAANGLFGKRGVASLTVQTQVPYAEGESTRQKPNPLSWAEPSRWGTLEFKFYYLVFLTIVPYMIYVPAQLSSTSSPNYPRFASHLVPGWLFGRQRVSACLSVLVLESSN